jgi:hypothetical protein
VITNYTYPVPSNSQAYGIAAGSDGALWFTEYNGNQIGRAPACGLGFSTKFSGGTLTLNFDLGIDTPATLNILILNSAGVAIGEPFSKAISPVVPPKAFTLTWNPFPNKGTVTVKPILIAGPRQPICSEWGTVDTAQ